MGFTMLYPLSLKTNPHDMCTFDWVTAGAADAAAQAGPRVTDKCQREVEFHGDSSTLKHFRCNSDVAPRLTSGGYEDKVDVITPINILYIGVGNFGPLWR